MDKFLEKWSSSHVDVRIRVRNFVDPIEVTVVIYVEDVSNTLCKIDFRISSSTDALRDLWQVCSLLTAKGAVKARISLL